MLRVIFSIPVVTSGHVRHDVLFKAGLCRRLAESCFWYNSRRRSEVQSPPWPPARSLRIQPTPRRVRRDVSLKLPSHYIELGFHHHILACQVWARGCILVPGLHLGCVYTKKAYASSGLIQNLEPNWQLFGKMSISNERRLWPRASSLIGKETLQFGIGLFVDCGSGF